MAATATMGILTIPEMRKRGYSDRLAVGSVGAAGGLAHLIPPSVLMVIYASMTEQSVADMFMAGVMPGIVLMLAFMAVVLCWKWFRPNSAPTEEVPTWRERFLVLRKSFWPIILVFAVLGTIYTGIATVTEAAAIGAIAKPSSSPGSECHRLELSLLERQEEEWPRRLDLYSNW